MSVLSDTSSNTLSDTVARAFVKSYGDAAQRVHLLAEGVSEEQFWRKPYPYGNSFGHLTLHLIGNLNHLIGAQIAGTGYVRDREREFTESATPPKGTVLARLDETVAMVETTLRAQTDDTWVSSFQAPGEEASNRLSLFLRCAAHFQHHIGQMIYLEQELKKSVS